MLIAATGMRPRGGSQGMALAGEWWRPAREARERLAGQGAADALETRRGGRSGEQDRDDDGPSEHTRAGAPVAAYFKTCTASVRR
jgi:hypothetical protein